jgi:hypothetical protein
MKTYVLTVSTKFPKGHIREGEPTNFVEKILSGEKIHTIRGNYPLWYNRIKEVQAGKAKISLRYWSGKPYNSKQIEFKCLYDSDFVGVQGVAICTTVISAVIDNKYLKLTTEICENDGLNYDDFESWFKKDVAGYFGIIHFTGFRYANT